MHLYSGWKAYVNKLPVTYDKYLGILPAIPVAGAAHVEYKFESGAFRLGAAVSAVGFVLFLLFGAFCLKADRRI